MQAAKFVLQLIKTSCKEGVTSSRRFGDVYKSVCYVEASLITFLFLSSLGDPALPHVSLPRVLPARGPGVPRALRRDPQQHLRRQIPRHRGGHREAQLSPLLRHLPRAHADHLPPADPGGLHGPAGHQELPGLPGIPWVWGPTKTLPGYLWID